MLVSKIRDLCTEHGTTLVGLERSLGFSRGSITKWKASSPSSEKLKQVADYFNVSTDYLLDREDFITQRIPVGNILDSEILKKQFPNGIGLIRKAERADKELTKEQIKKMEELMEWFIENEVNKK